tara:strand:+ start:119 stop:703 length:585 start_codon:yes stop_codon:yes gene_type:complete
MMQDIVFWGISVIVVVAAIGVVTVRDLFRSALLLAVVFVGVAGYFFLLSAEFLAVVQILIYVGAISILFIFAIMLTTDIQRGNMPNRLQVIAVLIPCILLSALIVTVYTSQWVYIPDSNKAAVSILQTRAVGNITDQEFELSKVTSEIERETIRNSGIANLLTGKYVLAFEAVSVTLLAALVGSLALARGRRPQ